MNDKFDLNPNIIRTRDERIEMVTDPDCPLETIHIVATHDTEIEVIEACAFNKNTNEEIMNIVIEKTKKSKEELLEMAVRFHFKNNPDIKNSFCTVPWNHVSTNADGSMRICCQMIYDDKEMPHGSLYHNDGTAITGNDEIENMRNAKNWKTIRKAFTNGEKPDICKLCWDEEKYGIKSRREFSLDNQELVTRAISLTETDGSIKHDDFPIEWWDLRFGNRCNLKCRSCGPNDSDQWYDDWMALKRPPYYENRDGKKIAIKKIKAGKYTSEMKYDWYEDSPLWNYITSHLETSRRFYFTGGEPTINHKHKELLQLMIDKDIAKDISLEYNTNMAAIPESMFDMWSNFKFVGLGMSIDGIYEHFEYIRHPGKWKSVERNMRRLDDDPRLNNSLMHITLTLSIMNVLHILDMIWWLKEQKFDRIDKNIFVHNLYGPEFLNVQTLPEGMKTLIEERYSQFINDINKRWPHEKIWNNHTEKTLETILSHMKDKQGNEKIWRQFLEFTNKMDDIRKEKWSTSLPEIAETFKRYNEIKQRKQKIELATANKRKR